MMDLLFEERLINSSIGGSVATGQRKVQNSMKRCLVKKINSDHIAGLERL